MAFPLSWLTKRFILRPLLESDSSFIFSLRSDTSVNTYLEREPFTHRTEADAFILKISEGVQSDLFYYWAICLEQFDQACGTICLWNFNESRTTAEIGYELLPEFQKQGIMDESLKAVIHHAYVDLHLKTIEAFTHKDNRLLFIVRSKTIEKGRYHIP